MKLQRFIVTLLIAGASWAGAQVGDARQPQIDAAVANAVDGLYREIARTPVYAGVTAGDVVEKVGGREEIIKTLQGAQEIGGPRWLDDQTAQVRLEIAGSRVAQVVIQLAASNPKRTPVKADALAPLLADWDRKTFGAVGTSTGATTVVEVRPVGEDPAWAAVPEAARKEAISAARTNAVQHVVDGVRGVELKPGTTAGQIMDRPGSPVRGAVESYVQSRPVTSVRFTEDRQVEVGISAPASDVVDVLRASVEGMKDPQLTDVDWGKVHERLVGKMGGMGVAKAGDGGGRQGGAGVALRVPEQPPEWVWRQIDASGTAQGTGSALKCARAAEAQAMAKIQAQVEGLALAGMTLGEAGKRDAHIAEAVGRGVSRARVYKTDYHADGTVTVYVSLDMRDVWNELRLK